MNPLLFKKTLRDLRHSAAQTIALIVIVALGVASLMALIGAFRDLGRSYQHTYDALHFADTSFDLQGAPESAVSDVASVSGVAAATGRLVIDSGITVPANGSSAGTGSTREIRSRLIGIAAGQRPEVDDVRVIKGSYFSAPAGPSGKSSSNNASSGSADLPQVLLEAHFANAYGYRPGDVVRPLINGKETRFRVAGVVASPEYLIVSASRQDVIPSAKEFGVLFVPLGTLQKLTGRDGEVNNIVIRRTEGASDQTVTDAVSKVLAPWGITSVTARKDQPSASALQLDLDGYQQIGYLMPALILLAAAAALFVMLGRQIRSQRIQIGLMKALGYRRGAVAFHYLTIAVIVSVLGALVGIGAGYPLGHEITSEYAAELGIPLVTSSFYPDLAAVGAVVSILVAIIAGSVPALRAASLPPAEAMRPNPEAASARGKRSWLDRVLKLSVNARLPVRNVFRNPGRAFSTLVGVIFAYVLVLAALGMMDSMKHALFIHFNRVERWDVSATFNEPQSPAVLARIQSMDGVQQADPLLMFPATATGANTGTASGKGTDLLLTATDPTATLHQFNNFQGSGSASVALSAGKILLTDSVAAKLGVEIGDRIMLQTPFGRHELEVGGTVQELSGGVAYVSLATARQWIPFHLSVFNGVNVSTTPGAAASVRSMLYHLPGAASVTLKTAMQAAWETLIGLYYAIMGTILVFSLAMAFALLFNAMTVNVLEQQREFATMRSIGAGRGVVARIMTMENLLLWLISLVPGIVLGRLAAGGILGDLNSDLFSLSVYLSPASYVFTALGILATMILAALPSVRRVNRLNLAVATKVLT